MTALTARLIHPASPRGRSGTFQLKRLGPRPALHAQERIRTSTPYDGHQPLKLARLPVPPPGQAVLLSAGVPARGAGRVLSGPECSGGESNPHGSLVPQGPEPCASANSATRARGASAGPCPAASAGHPADVRSPSRHVRPAASATGRSQTAQHVPGRIRTCGLRLRRPTLYPD